MDVERRDIEELLKREFIFQHLAPEQLAWVAAQFEPVEYDRDQVIFSQNAPADYFYVIYKGMVRVIRTQGSREEALNVLGPGEIFGEYALLFDRTRWATFITVEKSILLRMPRSKFELMLNSYPEIRENMLATSESRSLARTRHFTWLGANEAIQYMTRKHDFFLITNLIPPILLGIASIPVLAFAISQMGTPFLLRVAGILGVLMLLGSASWGVWAYLDWGNDYFIVTNERVIWLEKVIGLYDSRREAPLDTVLAVNVTSSQLGRWIGYGDVSVRTFTGGIRMNRVNKPYRFANIVDGFKQRSLRISKEQEVRTMEQELEQALVRKLAPPKYTPPPVPDLPPLPVVSQVTTPSYSMTWEERLRNFLKVRYVEGNIITYRKHWFVLLGKAWKPLAGILAVVGGLTAVISTGSPLLIDFISSFMGIVLIVLLLGAFSLWLLYDYVDWSNDIYRLTPEQIFDIERKPLGQEVKKSAPLESILSIEHERENILGIILNYGVVVVSVGETKFVFFGVFNPDQVHADIADYRDALNRRKKAAEAAQYRKQMVEWLVAFYDQTERMEDIQGDSEAGEISG